MIRIGVAGAKGRMGRRILELACGTDEFTIAGAFDLPHTAGEEITCGTESGRPAVVRLAPGAKEALADADVLVDFTTPAASLANVGVAAAAGLPSVVGTTGLSDADGDRLRQLAQRAPIVFAPNMSVGVNLLFRLTEQVARLLGLDYNVEITEIHHNQKKDSPSGTAVRLAELAARGLDLEYPENAVYGRHGMIGARPRAEIGIHALRGGDVVGEHTVAFIGQGERLELTHKAHNRDNFARGALVAARFVVKAQPGLYDMQDVLGLR